MCYIYKLHITRLLCYRLISYHMNSYCDYDIRRLITDVVQPIKLTIKSNYQVWIQIVDYLIIIL